LERKNRSEKPIPLHRRVKTAKKTVLKGEQYTFKLRSDIRFQDDECFPGGKGRSVTANDLLYSFKRMMDPRVQSPVASFFADKVIGWSEYSAAFEKLGNKNYDNNFPGIQVDPKDPQTLHVYLSQPYPQLRYLMAMHFTTPQAREAVEYWKEDYKLKHPVGCGMFMLTEYRSKQRIALEANPNRYPSYFPSEGMPGDKENGALRDAGKRLPLSDKVVFTVVKEGVTAFNLFLQGYLDMSAITNTNATQVMQGNDLSPDMKRRGVTMRKDVTASIRYGFFNMDDPDWGGYTPQKRKLRQAVALAIDTQAMIDVFNRGNGVLAQTMLPPGVYGYDPNYKNPYRVFDPNLAKAKQLLSEAGYANGIDPKTGSPLTLTMDGQTGSPETAAMFELFKRQIEKLGIKVTLVFTRYSVWQDKTNKGQFQFCPIYGWFADYPDPENFMFLLYSVNKAPGPNSSFYNNPAYDKLFLQMRQMEDGPERFDIIQKMQKIATEDSPVIPLYHDVSFSLSQAWVRNSNSHPISNDDSQYRAIDVPLRNEKQAEWNRPNLVPLWFGLVVLIAGIAPAVRVIGQRTNRKVRRADAVMTGEEA
jgi:oligopeptide transport system substrate-binding protein